VLLNNLQSFEIILASGSPRRRQLLSDLSLSFEVLTSNASEEYPISGFSIPIYIARQKAMAVQKEKPQALIIAADTVVIKNNKLLGKPENKEQAVAFLKTLSNTRHDVTTGVCLLHENKAYTFHETTEVYFKNLSDEEIDYYIEKYQPYDKAGAYGIQEWIGMIGIQKIVGDYFNVVGLPVARLCSELERFINPNTINVSPQNNIDTKYLYFNS
jgi:septum formation protein